MTQGTILIIDDETQLRKLLARLLTLEGYTVLEAPDARSAQKLLDKSDVHVILSDVKLPDGNGVELTRQLKSSHPDVEILVLTAYGNIADGVQAIKNGAFDYLTKGDDNNRILPLVSKAMDKAKLQFRVRSLEEKLGGKHDFSQVIGASPRILEAVNLARKVAATDATVLLLGETGSGRRYSHRRSTAPARARASHSWR